MANYTPITDFAAKDALPSGDPAKLAKGTDVQDELNAIATAIATKANSTNPTLSGTVSVSGSISGATIDGGSY